MFKNFDKVFKFTFKNQTSPQGYRVLTLVTAVILLILPTAVFLIANKVASESEDKVETCGAEIIYIVNPESPDADFNMLNLMNIEGYTDIRYINAETVQDAIKSIKDKGQDKAFVLQFKKEDNQIEYRMVLPENTSLQEEDVVKYEDFVKKTGNIFTILASGINMTDLTNVMMQTEASVYDTEGYKSGTDLYSDDSLVSQQKNAEILPIFNIILTYITLIVIYMVIILYGNTIMQTVILEKSNKLMDTMLISVAPQAMIFGKMLGILAAGLLQIFTWLVSAIIGIIVGINVMDGFYPGVNNSILTFIKSFTDMGLFKPINVIIAVFALIFGILMYCSFSAMTGSISSSREEAASNQGIFVMILVGAFYLVLFNGLNSADVKTWLYLCPFTSAMVLPAGVCTGTISTGIAAGGLGIMILMSVIGLVLAGKLYTMMSLYKGNKVNLVKAFKMLIGK